MKKRSKVMVCIHEHDELLHYLSIGINGSMGCRQRVSATVLLQLLTTTIIMMIMCGERCC